MAPRCVGVSAATLSAITLHIGHVTRPTGVVKGDDVVGWGEEKHSGIHYTDRLTV